MHCYHYLAAVARIADAIESLPAAESRIPLGVLADWMEENGIEADDVLEVSGDEVKTIVESAIGGDQPHLPHAA